MNVRIKQRNNVRDKILWFVIAITMNYNNNNKKQKQTILNKKSNKSDSFDNYLLYP